MKIYVTTSDWYNPLIPGFAYLFNKYWSPAQEVTILCYTKPDYALPENFSLQSLGDAEAFGFGTPEWSSGSRGRPFNEPWPMPRWTDSLRPVFENLEDEHFLLLQIDYFIHRPVELGKIEVLKSFLAEEDVVRLDLFETRQYHRPYATRDGLEVVAIQTGPDYRQPYFKTSLQAAIWQRDFFVNLLVPNRNPWMFEWIGMFEMVQDQHLVLGLDQPGDGPIPYTNIYKQGQVAPNEIDRIDRESLAHMIDQDMIGPWWNGWREMPFLDHADSG